MNGWFPALNSRGLVASGAGEVFIGDRSLGRGHDPDFATDDLVVFCRPSAADLSQEETVAVDVASGTVRAAVLGGYNRIAAGGGRCLGFLAPASRFGPSRVELRRAADLSLVRSWTDAAVPVMAPGGRWAFSDRYQSDVHRVWLGDGETSPVEVFTGATMELSVSDTALCIQVATGKYTRAVIGFRAGSSTQEDWSVLDWEMPTVVDGPNGEPWVLSGTQTGMILRPAGAKVGYQWAGDWYVPAIRFINGEFWIEASDDAGQRKRDRVDPRAPRVRLDVAPAVTFAFDHDVMIAPFRAEGSGAPDVFSLGLYTEAPDPQPELADAERRGLRLLLAHDAIEDWTLPSGLRSWDIPFFELYLRLEETLEESVARWFRLSQQVAAQWPGVYGVIPMMYDQFNPKTGHKWSVAEMLDGLRHLAPVVNVSPRCKVIAPFSYNRLNGIVAYPELQAALTALLKAAPGVVTLPQPAPTTTPPPPPPRPRPTPLPTPRPTPPRPTPPPVHEGDLLMFSTFSDPTKRLLAVKSVKSVSGGGAVLENPDGTIVSIQPDGRVEDRPAGADGGYERCKVSGNAATFKPADGKYYTFAFVIVEGL